MRIQSETLVTQIEFNRIVGKKYDLDEKKRMESLCWEETICHKSAQMFLFLWVSSSLHCDF